MRIGSAVFAVKLPEPMTLFHPPGNRKRIRWAIRTAVRVADLGPDLASPES
jgi:hypothetical protein